MSTLHQFDFSKSVWRRSDDFFFLHEFNVRHLKLEAKRRLALLRKTNPSVKLTSVLDVVAQEKGFSHWAQLNSVYKHELEGLGSGKCSLKKDPTQLFDYLTFRQQEGAISRKFGIDPFLRKHSIHITICEERVLEHIDNSDLEKLGIVEDDEFQRWLFENDRFFGEGDFESIYRVLSLDTSVYEDVHSYFAKLSDQLESFWPLLPGFMWIDGRIDVVDPDPDYPNDIKPMKEIPSNVWRSRYL